jgi:peptidoglycan/LPS O-acetylase OafA/YrhL
MGRILAGVFLILLSLFMLLGFLQADLPAGPAARIIFFIILVLAPALGGGALLRSWFSRRRKARERKELLGQQTLQVEILKLAGANGGALRAIDAVAELGISQEEADAALERLAVRGAAEVDITESGALVYRFDEAHLPWKLRSTADAKER